MLGKVGEEGKMAAWEIKALYSPHPLGGRLGLWLFSLDRSLKLGR